MRVCTYLLLRRQICLICPIPWMATKANIYFWRLRLIFVCEELKRRRWFKTFDVSLEFLEQFQDTSQIFLAVSWRAKEDITWKDSNSTMGFKGIPFQVLLFFFIYLTSNMSLSFKLQLQYLMYYTFSGYVIL